MTERKETIKERTERLLKGEVAKSVPEGGETEKVKKTPYGGKANPNAKAGRSYIPKGAGNGGKRPGSGRKGKDELIVKRGIKAMIDGHTAGEVKIVVRDPKTGQTREISKPRMLVLLDDLFVKAHNDKDVQAIREYFDRAVGKSAQPIRGDENDDTPIRLEHDIHKILNKAYGDD